MFNNIGEKIKTLVKIIFVIEVFTCIVLGIVLLALDRDLLSEGLLVLFLGPVISYVEVIIGYGFGQLVVNSDKLVRKNTNTEKPENGNEVIQNATDEVNYATSAQLVQNDDSQKLTENVATKISDLSDKTIKGDVFIYSLSGVRKAVCHICNKPDVYVYKCVISGKRGMRNCDVCNDCLKKHNAKSIE